MRELTLGSTNVKEFKVFPNYYISVSDSGEVYTHDCEYTNKKGQIFRRKGRRLKQTYDRYGYLAITVSHQSQRKTYKVHRLVACTFIPNPENKPTVNHINGNKDDNRVENLEWATQYEQTAHAIKHGLRNENLRILANYNRGNAKKVKFKGTEFCSIREASRQTGFGRWYVKHHCVFMEEGGLVE